MSKIIGSSRRALLKKLALGTALLPLLNLACNDAFADDPLLQSDDPAAKARSYVENANQAKAVPPGRRCSNCALYEGTAGSMQGPCSVFPGRQVKAAGWCSAWVPQM